MSDIKKKFTCEHGSWKSSCDICHILLEVDELKAENASLITTIESQKEIIAHQGKSLLLERQQIESQKEEIEKTHLEKLQWNSKAIEMAITRDKYFHELQSQKAITELAVKGLKKVLCVRHDGLVSSEIFTGEVGTGQEKCQEIAQSALDQIERLSHE